MNFDSAINWAYAFLTLILLGTFCLPQTRTIYITATVDAEWDEVNTLLSDPELWHLHPFVLDVSPYSHSSNGTYSHHITSESFPLPLVWFYLDNTHDLDSPFRFPPVAIRMRTYPMRILNEDAPQRYYSPEAPVITREIATDFHLDMFGSLGPMLFSGKQVFEMWTTSPHGIPAITIQDSYEVTGPWLLANYLAAVAHNSHQAMMDHIRIVFKEEQKLRLHPQVKQTLADKRHLLDRLQTHGKENLYLGSPHGHVAEKPIDVFTDLN